VSNWNTFKDPLVRVHLLPDTPACYIFRFDRRFIYIGSTGNLYVRFLSHGFHFSYDNDILTPWGSCDTFVMKYKTYQKYGQWMMDEARLIRRLQPVLNVHHSGKGREIRKTTHGVKRVEGVPVVEAGAASSNDYLFATIAEYVSGKGVQE